jgi:hypothetical protein
LDHLGRVSAGGAEGHQTADVCPLP